MVATFAACGTPGLRGDVLDKQQQLDRQTFWDNRDWDWYAENIPFFDCPDADLVTTYYYRWELLTKHLTYGSPNSGYSFTEFIDRPFWSGAYGAISCPAGHQLYEARWLRNPRVAQDYARYWLQTPGAQPRNYSTWLADSVWAVHQVYNDRAAAVDLLAGLVKNYAEWERRQWVPEVGLFWQTGHDDGMEFNINSRQTSDILRGAPSFRPSFNAYLWADAVAIAQLADLAGDATTAEQFRAKAATIKQNLQTKLWDPQRAFFFPMLLRDEERDGFKLRAQTLTYRSGRYDGDPHGRELIGYVPWQFNLPDDGRGYEQAWKFLMDEQYFRAPFGPMTVERGDPQFLLKNSCCWWSGQSWPYATTQTLKAAANLLRNYQQDILTRDDYFELLQTYSRSHRKNGRPYLAEALHPETGSFDGHDGYNHSEHYFHSGFCDLVITGLVGLVPRSDDVVEVDPLAPPGWDYFALDDVNYHGRRLSIVWDRDGTHYRRGVGLQILVDDKPIASSARLQKLSARLPPRSPDRATAERPETRVNYAVNNDGDYYPQVTASHTGPQSAPTKAVDGNYWYHRHPPNRWTTIGSEKDADWLVVDFGAPRRIDTIKVYLLEDDLNEHRDGVVCPKGFDVEVWRDDAWQAIENQTRRPASPTGRRANIVRFAEQAVSKFRIVLHHAPGKSSGLTEVEAWGSAELPVAVVPPPAGNLAFRRAGPDAPPFPKITASHTSRFDQLSTVNDGRIVFTSTPANRWTSFESPTSSDWLEIDFGRPEEVGRVELYVYDDRGGVQAPAEYRILYADGPAWHDVANIVRRPERPTGGVRNTVTFDRVRAAKLRVEFIHQGKARSGLTELEVWKE
jgi:hypothetical protein